MAICEVIGTGALDKAARTVTCLGEDNVDAQPSYDATTALYSGRLRDEGII